MEKAAVIGAGTMGHGIARILAAAGFSVALHDAREGAAEAGIGRIRGALDSEVRKGALEAGSREAILGRLRAAGCAKEAVEGTQLVVEAIPENLEWKQRLFGVLDREAPSGAILATNTSSLSVTRIAAAAARPGRVLGLHFFNPPHRMRLLEIVRGDQTEEAVVERALNLARRLGKEAIVVKDSPGFATSRLGVALGLEAMRMLEEGVAAAGDIDRAMELGYGHPMGPLRVSDLVGLDVRLSIAESLHRELGGDRFRPPSILREMVKSGRLGKKTGGGFYPW